MNDLHEDKFGMYLKVSHFLGVNATLLSVNTLFAAKKTILDTSIADITAQDVIAQTDLTGYTQAKGDAELALQESVLHVGHGLHGYFIGLGDKPMQRKVDFTKSDILRSRDANLNTLAELVHQIGDPVKTLLAPNEVTAADVDALNTKRLAFLALFSVPREKQGDSKAAREELVRLFTETDLMLKEELDGLMSVYEVVNPVLHSKYETARMIDDSGGGSGSEGYTLQNYTVPAGGLVQIGTTPLPEREAYLRNLSAGSVVVCTTDGTTGPCASGYTLNGNTLFKNTFGTLGLNQALPLVQVSNPGGEDVLIRAGLKAV